MLANHSWYLKIRKNKKYKNILRLLRDTGTNSPKRPVLFFMITLYRRVAISKQFEWPSSNSPIVILALGCWHFYTKTELTTNRFMSTYPNCQLTFVYVYFTDWFSTYIYYSLFLSFFLREFIHMMIIKYYSLILFFSCLKIITRMLWFKKLVCMPTH